jgi:hypothetical protein
MQQAEVRAVVWKVDWFLNVTRVSRTYFCAVRQRYPNLRFLRKPQWAWDGKAG